eukprot:650701-Prymnesium_polylepis.1
MDGCAGTWSFGRPPYRSTLQSKPTVIFRPGQTEHQNLKPQPSTLNPQTSNLRPQTSNLEPQASDLKYGFAVIGP